jgi:hypothetical protein
MKYYLISATTLYDGCEFLHKATLARKVLNESSVKEEAERMFLHLDDTGYSDDEVVEYGVEEITKDEHLVLTKFGI